MVELSELPGSTVVVKPQPWRNVESSGANVPLEMSTRRPHCPATQTPEVQRLPQAPQLLTSLLTSRSHPLATWPSQSTKPVEQVPTVHAPASQLRPACGTAAQAVQPPQ